MSDIPDGNSVALRTGVRAYRRSVQAEPQDRFLDVPVVGDPLGLVGLSEIGQGLVRETRCEPDPAGSGGAHPFQRPGQRWIVRFGIVPVARPDPPHQVDEDGLALAVVRRDVRAGQIQHRVVHPRPVRRGDLDGQRVRVDGIRAVRPAQYEGVGTAAEAHRVDHHDADLVQDAVQLVLGHGQVGRQLHGVRGEVQARRVLPELRRGLSPQPRLLHRRGHQGCWVLPPQPGHRHGLLGRVDVLQDGQ
ncbi:hypothetical protein WKI68_01520 [Streptomyces sp. MS1.HAVA.3]|uniref:Uncharacterized protein n=1 Tax=Streptomyces caledonius TaxID=3134107 RepID=A0ABU8TXW8_9ACTN